mmetsp:Transcript_2093/g.2661  ORF Transcript_2093/g.2661 Transcript_2093/m.2661 type:complete len:88 (-) Transcript_2093:29-292(-)
MRKDDNQGRIQSISSLVEYLDQETDSQTFMRMLAAIGNLTFEDSDVQSLAEDLGVLEKFESLSKFKGQDSYELCTKYINEIKLIISK